MRIIEILTNFLFRWKIDHIISKTAYSNRKFIVEFPANESLPIEIWTYLIKLKADFRCEDCGSTKLLVSHHFSPLEKSKNIHILNHGKCLCTKCHVANYTMCDSGDRVAFYSVYGKDKGRELFNQFKEIKTREDRKSFTDKLVSEDKMKAYRLGYVRLYKKFDLPKPP